MDARTSNWILRFYRNSDLLGVLCTFKKSAAELGPRVVVVHAETLTRNDRLREHAGTFEYQLSAIDRDPSSSRSFVLTWQRRSSFGTSVQQYDFFLF